MNRRTEVIRQHFDSFASQTEKWRRRNKYYHRELINYFRYLVDEGKSVLELGSGPGDLLHAIKPAVGVGIDISPVMVEQARKQYPDLQFRIGDADNLDLEPQQKFDYIVLSDMIGYLDDVEECFNRLHDYCAPETRLVISYHNFLWEPLLRFGEFFGLKMPTPKQSWLSPEDMANLLSLSGFEVVKLERRLLFPKYVPLLSALLNKIGTLPGINRACLIHYLVARPLQRNAERSLSTSIVVPCKNEQGNIEHIIQRLPHFGSKQEVIFVDGHSHDGTQAEIQRVITEYPARDIKLLIQDGEGKGDAVRKGFQAAGGDLLIILDADLTVPPEDLPKFYRVIAGGGAEFANGSRLVYPMEGEAMRALNLAGNKFFALAFTWLLGQRFKDTLCGTKALLARDYRRLEANRRYFGEFDPFGDFDLIFGASKLNLKIVEVPIRYRRRTYGESQISRYRHGALLLRMVIFAFRKIKGI